MPTTKIDLANGLHWPNRCAYCNKPATKIAKTHFRVIDGFYLIAIRETTHTVTFPVCSKHLWPAKMFGWVTNQAIPTGFCMALLFPVLGTMALALLLPWKYAGPSFYVLCAATPFLFAYLKLRNPVKVLGVKKNVATIRLLNPDYAASFNVLNPPESD